MKILFTTLTLLLSIQSLLFSNNKQSDSTYILRNAIVSASLKEDNNLRNNPLSATSIPLFKIEREQLASPKELSLITPNLFIPDYGSKMTSSIYVRGLGARIDQPAVGLYVDNVPYLNKNNYDIEFFDIQKIDILRGPQGTLYGRNTIGGVINIYTLSPLTYQGTKVSIDYGSWNTLNIRTSVYLRNKNKKGLYNGYSVAAYYRRSDGAYTNSFNNKKCDTYNGGGARLKGIWEINKKFEIEHTISADYIKQDGYAYAKYDTLKHEAYPINYNDPCNYKRFTLTNGLRLQYYLEKVRFSSITSWQYTDDKMNLDQDFQPKSMFTLTQAQKEHAFTQDFIATSNNINSNFQWIGGIFAFHKNLRMDAPVIFGQDGINELILKNANDGIHKMMPSANLELKDPTLPLNSKFTIPTTGAALYGQASYKIGEDQNYWKFTAGIRLDYEHSSMTYNNFTTLSYKLTPIMSEYRDVPTTMNGTKRLNFTELLPKVSIMKVFNSGNVYISASKGYKAGGFNTQIFSDILQNKLTGSLMGQMRPGYNNNTSEDETHKTSYKPEYSWNFEVGSHLTAFNNKLSADISGYYIICKDQQITVFPEGQSTGRMMSNAGRSRSTGAEIALSYIASDIFKFEAAYGYTNAKFKKYYDGKTDYSGKYVPYAPQNTVYTGIDYSIPLKSIKGTSKIILHLDWSGAGKIYWDENNYYSQSFYNLLGAYAALNINKITLTLFGKNLTNSKYNTFYFKSVGNSFVQIGKPRMLGVSLSLEL